jgi:mechanosensitive ion channel-like protein
MEWSSFLSPFIPPDLGAQLQETLFAVTGALTLILIAGAIALVGWLLAVLLSRAAQSLLSMTGLDGPAKRLAADSGIRPELLPSRLVGFSVFWLTILGTAIVALRVLGLDLVPSIVIRLQDVVPRILTSGLVLLLGIPLALTASRLLTALLLQSGVRPSRIRAQGVAALLIAFTVLIALDQLGLAAHLVLAVAIAIVAAAGLALALAFGLGCRDLARDLIVEYLRASDEGRTPDRT